MTTIAASERGRSRLASDRVGVAKLAFSTRRVDPAALVSVLDNGVAPRPGDIVLARVDSIGQHGGLQLASGRRATLFPGDEIVVTYGNRYAPDQFEAEVPPDLSPCHLVAAGGIAARELSRHQRMSGPTEITPVGLLGTEAGRPANVADWALARRLATRRPFSVAVVGSSMNSGKSTTAANLVRGLVASGLAVGAAKVTGTAAPGDLWLLLDAGARPVVDFTDAGLATTYRATAAQVEDVFEALTGHLAECGVDAIVLEVADGLFQSETEALLSSPRFADVVDGVLFAANGALAAAAGVEWLSRRGLNVLGISGVLSSSPLAVREAELATGLPVLAADALRDPSQAERLRAVCAIEAAA